MSDKFLYPLEYKGKKWKKEECAPMFVAYYRSPESLAWDKSVYTGDGDWILPDGTWSESMCR